MDPTIARLRYLNDSAHLLTLSSPASAAAFQSRYDQVAEHHDVKPLDSRQHQICSACGFNMLSTAMYAPAPQGKTGGAGTKRKQMKKTLGHDLKEIKMVVLECRACLSTTEVELEASKRSKPASGRKEQHDSATSSRLPSTPTQNKAASTQSNRAKAKRAKTRTSLHAMLAKSKEQAQSNNGFGLDLMDIMKST